MTEPQKTQKPLVKELNAMGKKLGDALRTALDSPQRQEIEQEVREGFGTVVNEINEALAKARTSDVTRDLGQQAEKLVDTVKSKKVTGDVRQGLIKGLKTLNQELDSLVNRLQTESPESEAPPAEDADPEETP